MPVVDKAPTKYAKRLIEDYTHLQTLYQDDNTTKIINTISDFLSTIVDYVDIYELTNAYLKLLKQINIVVPSLSSNKSGYANLINKHERLLLLVDLKSNSANNTSLNYDRLDNAKFINLASLLDTLIRHENRNPTFQEYLTRQIAFEMINIRGYNEAPIVP